MFGWFSGTKAILNPVHGARGGSEWVRGKTSCELMSTCAIGFITGATGSSQTRWIPRASISRQRMEPTLLYTYSSQMPPLIPFFLPPGEVKVLPATPSTLLHSPYLPLVPGLTVIHFILYHIGYFSQYLNNFVAVLIISTSGNKVSDKKKCIMQTYKQTPNKSGNL